MNINHISVSRKDVWKTCKAKYKFKYHLKVKSPEVEAFYFTYGKIFHKIAEEFVLGKGKIPLQKIADSVTKGKILIEDYEGNKQAAPHLPLEYQEKLGKHLVSLSKITEQLGFEGDVEYPFEYDLDPPNKKLIVGFIDRLINKGSQIYIIDYKTTRKGSSFRKTEKTIVQDLQLRCYARIVQKRFNVPAKSIKAGLYYVEGGKLLGAQFSEDSLESAEKEMLSTYKEIESTSPNNAWGTMGRHCDYCEYKSICPFLKPMKLPASLS